jgi:hypothetical protein
MFLLYGLKIGKVLNLADVRTEILFSIQKTI